MRNYISFLLFLIVLPFSAQTIAEETARETAAAFLLEKTGVSASPRRVRSVTTSLQTVVRNDAVYLFRDGSGAFVLTAADRRLPEILGYGQVGKGSVPATLESLLAGQERLLSASAAASTVLPYDGEPVAPLLTMTRHQEAPYNDYCPYYTDNDDVQSEKRCVVGCVATALEEVLTYYRRTVTLVDTLHGWETAHYDIPDLLPGTSVDTRLIRDNYNNPAHYTAEEADAVARLSYICGVAAHMRWGLAESGARVSALEEPLKRALGMGYVHYADSYKYRPDDWVRMIRAEIQARRPVLYAGYAMRMNGHAFVLDGLDPEGRFHVNWGVDGDYDGYFRLDVLYHNEPAGQETPTGQHEGYFANQEALLLHPDSIDVVLPDTLARTGLELQIDSLTFPLEAEQERCTPIRLYVKNTSASPLTTPLEIFANAPTDTAMYEQADYVALTSITLAPGESRELPLYGIFKKSGNRILRITADEKSIIYELPMRVAQRKFAQLTFPEPELTFPAPGEVRLCQPIINAPNAGRAGDYVLYELYEYAGDGTYRRMGHADYCLLSGGEAETDIITFRDLCPGNNCTLYVRYHWTPRQELHFTVPDATSVSAPVVGDDTASPWYDLSGRRVARPSCSGIYINKGRKVVVR